MGRNVRRYRAIYKTKGMRASSMALRTKQPAHSNISMQLPLPVLGLFWACFTSAYVRHCHSLMILPIPQTSFSAIHVLDLNSSDKAGSSTNFSLPHLPWFTCVYTIIQKVVIPVSIFPVYWTFQLLPCFSSEKEQSIYSKRAQTILRSRGISTWKLKQVITS